MVAALLAGSISRRFGDFALSLGFVGGLLVAWAAWVFLAGSQDETGRRRERIRTLIGALLIAAAFLLLLISRLAGGP
jgi:multisubunit Na+/H+ antiporter MnhB subunit